MIRKNSTLKLLNNPVIVSFKEITSIETIIYSLKCHLDRIWKNHKELKFYYSALE
jgi:hypothetical protein